MKQKLAAKALEERNKYTKQLFNTEKGKSFIQAIKEKVTQFIKKGETDKAKIGNKIIEKLIKNMKGVKGEVSNVLKMCRLLRGKQIERRNSNNQASLLNRNNREDAAAVLKLRETIGQRLKKIKAMEQSMFPGDSEDASESSEEYDSFLDEGCSDDENGNGEDNITCSINSSDLDSVDSQSDSESFKDIVTMLNNQFKWRMNRLMKHLKKKVESKDSDESDVDHKLFGEKVFPFRNGFAAKLGLARRKLEGANNIKQEVGEPKKKKREIKAEQKEVAQEEERVSQPNKFKKRFEKQKLSNVIDDFFFDKFRQGKSECSDSPKSSQSAIDIKQEEEENISDEDGSPQEFPSTSSSRPKTSLELFMAKFG